MVLLTLKPVQESDGAGNSNDCISMMRVTARGREWHSDRRRKELCNGGKKKKSGWISFFRSNFNFKVHLILYQLISAMLGDWRPSTLCIWLRRTEALESVMKKALGGIVGRGWHSVWVGVTGVVGWRLKQE